MRKKMKYVCLFFLPFFFVFMLLADSIINLLLFHPTKLPTNWLPPSDWNAEKAVFTNSKGNQLYGVYFPCDDSGGTILFSHGNAENIASWGKIGAKLRAKLNMSVFVYDYSGYGESEGRTTAAGILDDGRAARRWLAEHECIAEKDIILFGRSLGGAVAIDLAAKDGAKALVVECSFTSLSDMAKRFVPFLPYSVLLSEKLDSQKKIAGYAGPLFISHGTADTLIPLAHGKRLFDAALSQEKIFFPVVDAQHNDSWPDAYYIKIKEFLSPH